MFRNFIWTEKQEKATMQGQINYLLTDWLQTKTK